MTSVIYVSLLEFVDAKNVISEGKLTTPLCSLARVECNQEKNACNLENKSGRNKQALKFHV